MGDKKQRVVILGGGFAGLVTARKLVQLGVTETLCDITIVDRNPAHVYTPWLYEVSSGFLSEQTTRKEREDLFVSASVPFQNIPGYQNVHFRKAEVANVDPKEKAVHFSDGLALGYDVLFIALGSESNFFGIPGLPEHCFQLKSVADAIAVQQKAFMLLKQEQKGLRNIVIVGGGPSGVELAGELMMAIHTLVNRGELRQGLAKVTLVDRNKLLSVFAPGVNTAVVRRLKKIGVDVREGFSVVEAKQGELILKTATGELVHIPSDLCVWAGGVMPSKTTQSLPFPHDPKGKLLIDATFTVSGFPGVFAAGDNALLMNPLANCPEPQSAQVAVQQGKVVAKNIERFLRGQPLQLFPFHKGWDVLVAVGGRYGVGHVKGVTFSGYIGYAMRRITDFRYFSWILPLSNAVQKWRKAVTIYTNNDG